MLETQQQTKAREVPSEVLIINDKLVLKLIFGCSPTGHKANGYQNRWLSLVLIILVKRGLN